MNMKEFFDGLYNKPHMLKRLIMCFVSVTIIGFCVYWLNLVNFGNDPCSTMNFGIIGKVHMTLGNWQALFNLFLFIIIFFIDKSGIGFGTVLNMFVVGYANDFMAFIMKHYFPSFNIDNVSFGVRLAIMLVSIVIFIFVVAVYMAVDLGTAPYDAIPIIIANKQSKVPFKIVRIIIDLTATIIGFSLGQTVGVVTLIMAFTIGPAASAVKKPIARMVEDKELQEC
ncbi:YczE/YyaS/YitT family protein [Lachnobacterium bovis]|uniref:Uncharacterized membrane protein YczE n=1 Tax=Lachnobacterium bovis DSM 14045 TaxID=1122142 RepID=A0A1H3FVB5_9FIRM|nr:hypothetical protein [Lachnobacterium bovis]MBQ1801540.1 hypothetical protein [Lachnobacterium sp.]SDX95043.1 Uncharacterized membrane protein YczE [Lachnobacterium bovis DSM 14045]